MAILRQGSGPLPPHALNPFNAQPPVTLPSLPKVTFFRQKLLSSVFRILGSHMYMDIYNYIHCVCVYIFIYYNSYINNMLCVSSL